MNFVEGTVVGLLQDGGIADGSSAGKWQHPPSFYCPISQQCMHDPVVLSDGHSYERRHIERWLQGHGTSPVSGLPLAQKDLFSNHALRNAIEEYFQQVFSVHRRAIRKTMGGPDKGKQATPGASLVRTIDALMQCSLLMNADLSTEYVLRGIMEEAKTLLGAEVASAFLLDAEHGELYSTVNSTGGELCISVAVGIAGHVARSGEPLVVHDAYSDHRFDKTVDAKTGFRTRNVMCVPLKDRKGGVMGVAQLINKSRSEVSASEQMHCAKGVGDGIPSAGEDAPHDDTFTADDQHFFMVFASQAAAAIASSCNFATPQPSAASVQAGSSPFACDKAEQVGKQSPKKTTMKLATLGKEDFIAAEKLLEGAFDSWQLDAVALAKVTANRPLSVLGMYLFHRLGLVKLLGIDEEKLSNFLDKIESGYNESNPYHNRTHAASVLHSMHALLEKGGLMKAVSRTFNREEGVGSKCISDEGSAELERMACLLAAAIHDYEHMGLSNDFLVKTRSERAICYNDRHVNESHHVAAAFGVLLCSECNFLEHLPAKDFQRFRRLVIDLVVGTDMAEHGNILKSACEAFDASSRTCEAGIVRSAVEPASHGEAVLLLQLAIKSADLGHLALDWDLHLQCVQCLEEEFFRQGDKEKEAELPVSFLMDRCKPGASSTQVGFCEHVALPLFRMLAELAPGTKPALMSIEANYQCWKKLDALGSTPKSGMATDTSSQASGITASCAKPPEDSVTEQREGRGSFRKLLKLQAPAESCSSGHGKAVDGRRPEGSESLP